MSDFLDLPTLIIIIVAVAVLWRLRSVLGTRTGNERPPMDKIREKPQSKQEDETVVPLRPRPVETQGVDDERRLRKVAAEIEQYSRGDAAIADGLKEIADVDPTFSPKAFIEGAKSAYEMIVTAFAQGDRKTLKMLLDREVYEDFEKAIADREADGKTVDFTFVGLPGIEISGADCDRKNAQITLRFKAEVVSATRDKAGQLVEGNADQVTIIADEWSFARPVKSRDPNWKLVATDQLD